MLLTVENPATAPVDSKALMLHTWYILQNPARFKWHPVSENLVVNIHHRLTTTHHNSWHFIGLIKKTGPKDRFRVDGEEARKLCFVDISAGNQESSQLLLILTQHSECICVCTVQEGSRRHSVCGCPPVSLRPQGGYGPAPQQHSSACGGPWSWTAHTDLHLSHSAHTQTGERVRHSR